MSAQKEYKTFQFKVTETKEIDDNGQKYGLVKGLFSTYGNVDEVQDRVMPGAFTNSIAKFKSNGHQIPLLYMHKELIGGIPMDDVMDTQEGLMGTSLINLDVQRGKEAYSLAKQGVISSFSIGFRTIKAERMGAVRELKELDLFEVSMVPNPANVKARILAVKSNDAQTKFCNLKRALGIKNKRDFEKFLRDSGACTRKAAVYLSKYFIEPSQSESEGNEGKDNGNLIAVEEIINTLRQTTERLRNDNRN
jgi:HK97 family phage prohead protease